MESNHQSAERCASEWLTRRDSGLWTQDDQAALDRWLDESPIHAVAFIRLEAAWNQADRYKALGAGFAPRKVPTPEQVNRSPFFSEPVAPSPHPSVTAIHKDIAVQLPSRHPLRRMIGLKVVAAVLVAAMLGLLLYLQPYNRTFSTPVGGTATVPMRDGSRVTLNTNSEVKVAVTDAERRVQLHRGEAFFEVAHDPRRPFIVEVGSKRVVVLGTEFSVRLEGDNLRVAVTEGKVRVEDTASKLKADQSSQAEGAFVLSAGGVARAGEDGVLVQSQPVAEVLDTMSWRSGFVVFRNVDLAQAVAEFNRYNENKMVIQDPSVAAIRLSGKFKSTNVEAFVRLLEDGYPVVATTTDRSIVLEERRQ